MQLHEETIEATLDASGQLHLTHPPHLPAGRVSVTVRTTDPNGRARGLTDVLREIAADRAARGCPGRSSEEVRAEFEERRAEDEERDAILEAARSTSADGDA